MKVYLGFDLPDTIPVCNMRTVHDLQWRVTREAERRLGPRSHCLPIAPVTFAADSAGMYGARTQRVGGRMEITLGFIDLRDWATCALHLGHEVVHALDGLTSRPSHLEEGVASMFGADIAAAMFHDPPLALIVGDFYDAWQRVASIPNAYNVVRHLRAQGIALCNVTPQQLRQAAPTVSAFDAAALCRPFDSTSALTRAYA